MVGKIEDKQVVLAQEAQRIMGKNFFGIEHASEFFGFDPSSSEYKGLDFNQIPYNRETLELNKNSHFLVFVTPISIRNMVQMYPNLFSKEDGFFKNFAKKEGELGWLLIEKRIKENLSGKTLAEQVSALSPKEEIIKSQALIYFLVADFVLNSECLLFNSMARCSDISILDFRACIGKFDLDKGGISLTHFWDTASLQNLSVITVLKED